jgi:DNA-binding NarL/FixJ family response regulator
MAHVLVGCTDLIFKSRIAEAVKAAGGEVAFVRDAAGLGAQTAAGRPAVVLLDLNNAAFREAARVVLNARAADQAKPHIVGFYSHVDEATRQVALDAGCDEAMPRSAFVKRLAELVA